MTNSQFGAHGCGCTEFCESMYLLLDGHLSEAECDRLRAHVATCEKCQQLMEAEAEFRQLLRRCCCESAPVELRQRITYSIRIEHRR